MDNPKPLATEPKNSDEGGKKRRKRESSRSGTDSDSSSDSDSDSDSASASDTSIKKKRRHKSEKDDRKKKKKDKKEKDSRKKSKKSKHSKKDSKKKKIKDKKKKKSANAVEWGKHGIISESDYYTKESEFRSWLVHVKNMSPEDRNAKSLFAEFVEDYNTGTLPHEKFYNMEAWDRKEQREIYMQGGSGNAFDNLAEFDFARDEQRLKQQQRSATSRIPEVNLLTGDELRELKRVQEERVTAEKLKKLGFKPKDSMGVRYDHKLRE